MAEKDEKSAEPTPFPLVRAAFAVLVVHAVLVLATPPNLARSVTAILAVLSAGYCAIAVVAGHRLRLIPAEVLALSVGFAVLLTALAGILASSAGFALGDYLVLLAGIPLGLAAVLVHRSNVGARRSFADGLRGATSLPGYSRAEAATARILFAATLVALVVLLALFALPYPNALSPGLAIGGSDGTPQTLPAALAREEPANITITIFGGDAAGQYEVRVRLVPQNATGSEPFHAFAWSPSMVFDAFAEASAPVAVEAKGRWTQRVSVTVDAVGSFYLRFELLEGSTAIASNHVPLDIS